MKYEQIKAEFYKMFPQPHITNLPPLICGNDAIKFAQHIAKLERDALIADIDGLERIDFDEGGCDYPCSDGDNYRFDDVRAVLNKYRSAK